MLRFSVSALPRLRHASPRLIFHSWSHCRCGFPHPVNARTPHCRYESGEIQVVPEDGDQMVRVIVQTGGNAPIVPMAGARLRVTAALVGTDDVPALEQPPGDLHCAVLAWSRAVGILFEKHYDSPCHLRDCNVPPPGAVGFLARKNPMDEKTIVGYTERHGPFVGGVIMLLRQKWTAKHDALKAANEKSPVAQANRYYSKKKDASGLAAVAWVMDAVQAMLTVATAGECLLAIRKHRMGGRETGPAVSAKTPIPLGERGSTVLDQVLDDPELAKFMASDEVFIIQLWIWAGQKIGWAPHSVLLHRGMVYDSDPTVSTAPLAAFVDLRETPALVRRFGKVVERGGNGPWWARYGYVHGIFNVRFANAANAPMPDSFKKPAAGAKVRPYADGHWEASELLRSKKCNTTGVQQVLVRWGGLGQSQDTWEPASAMPPGMVEKAGVRMTELARERRNKRKRNQRAKSDLAREQQA